MSRESNATAQRRLASLRPSESGASALGLVRELCDELERAGIGYCHWKSNWEIDRSATGEKDLDLLVGPHQAQQFTELLWRLGFRESRGRLAQRIPGVLHHYALDPGSGELVHVHAHHQLIIGDDMTKNYRLPVEEAYIASASPSPLLRVPAPEFEFALLVIRIVLKHCTLDAVLSGRSALSPYERMELDHLIARMDLARVRDLVRTLVPEVGDALFVDCMDAVRRGAPLWSRLSTAHRLQHRLAPYARHPQVVDGVLRLWRRQSKRIRRRVLGRSTANTLGHGCVIGIVGGDGAGKSSAVKDLVEWLAPSFRTTQVHLGRPRRSALATVVRRSLRLGRWMGLVSGTPLRRSSETTDAESVPGTAWLVVRVLKARDRYRAHLQARRFAARGGIVVCDRYPISQIRGMDHPRASSLETRGLGTVARGLARLEQRYFDRITGPDLLIVLKVDPEVALVRRRDDEPDAVRARNEEVWNLEWDLVDAHIVDASRSKDEVLADIKSWVWSNL